MNIPWSNLFLILMTFLLCFCRGNRSGQKNLTDNSNEVQGKVAYVDEMDGLSEMLGIVTKTGDTVRVKADMSAFENVPDYQALINQNVRISLADDQEPVIYDMRIADDMINEPLNKTSINNYADMGETYSIIGRYVFSEVRGAVVFLEIEGREGTIYFLRSKIKRDNWADEEVECAVWFEKAKVAKSIHFN